MKRVNTMETIQRKKDGFIKCLEEKLTNALALIYQNSKKPKKTQQKIACQECEFEANSN